MLDEIPKPVLMLDPDLNIVRANQAFREEFGYDPRVVERGSKDVPLSSIVTNPYNLKRLGALAKIFMPLPDVPLGFQIPLKMRPSDRKKSWGTHLWFGNSRYHVANARVTINKRGEFVEAYLALGEELGNREVKRRAHEFQANREFRIGASEVIEYGTAEDYMRKMIHAYAFDFADSRPKEETPASIIVDMHDTKELLIDALYALRQMYMFSQSDEGRHISLRFTDVPYDITCMMQAAGIKMVEQAPQPESAKAQEKKVYVSQPIPAPVPLPLWT